MRIVFVAPFGLGQKSTVWARVLPLAHELAKGGEQVFLLIPPWDTPEDSGKTWVEDGVTIRHVSLGGGTPLVLLRLIFAVYSLNPHIVHIVKPRAYAGLTQWLLWWTRRISGRGPAIYLDLDDWEQAWNEVSELGPLMSLFLAWQEEWGIRHADGITAASLWLNERAAAYNAHAPALYLPNGVNLPVQQDVAETPNPSEQVLYLTRFVEVNAEWLARFWSALCSQRPGTKLIIAGGALQPGRAEQFCHRVKNWLAANHPEAAASICWLGLITRGEILDLYRTSSCAIFPAQNVPLQQAKCSVRLATTLLYGVPVIASAVGQQSEYGANHVARLVNPAASAEDFAEAVVDLLVRAPDRESVREAAQKHLIENFSWSKLGSQLHTFYREHSRTPNRAEAV